MSRGEVGNLLITISELYNQPPPSEAKLKIWFDLLKKYDYDTMFKALQGFAENSKFQPKPAELIKIYFDIVNAKRALEHQEAREKAVDCKYCMGTGFFKTMYLARNNGNQYYASYVTPCKCRGRADNLNKALASPEFKWSDMERAFVQTNEWIGDQKVEQIQNLEKEVENLANVFGF